MNETTNSKRYDLEDRTQKFARDTFEFVNHINKTLVNVEIIKPLVRSTGSVGANYIEANEALSKKDFILRIKICRKEAKESRYWLSLLQIEDEQFDRHRTLLSNEVAELMRIFGAIIEKSQ
jgi:four helix bundle protein